MTLTTSHLISVEIRQTESGWYTASSGDCPGLWLYGADRGEVIGLIPEAIELLYQAKSHQRVKAIRLTRPVGVNPISPVNLLPFATIPETELTGQGAA